MRTWRLPWPGTSDTISIPIQSLTRPNLQPGHVMPCQLPGKLKATKCNKAKLAQLYLRTYLSTYLSIYLTLTSLPYLPPSYLTLPYLSAIHSTNQPTNQSPRAPFSPSIHASIYRIVLPTDHLPCLCRWKLHGSLRKIRKSCETL